jgi:hypothetical protein
VCLCQVLVEGGGSKLGFGDENPEVYLWLDSSSSAWAMSMRRILVEGGGSKLAFGDENPRSIYGWTCYHRRTCDVFFLKA